MVNRLDLSKILTVIYFLISLVEIISEYFSSKIIIIIFKPLIPLLIIVMYLLESSKKNKLYIVAMIFSIVTNFLFIPTGNIFLYYAIIAFLIHRIFIVYLLLIMLF